MSKEFEIALGLVLKSDWEAKRLMGSFVISGCDDSLSVSGSTVSFNGRVVPNINDDEVMLLRELTQSKLEYQESQDWDRLLERFYEQ